MRKLAIALASTLGLAACGGSTSHSSSHSSTAAASKPAAAPCRTVPVPAPKGPQHLAAPKLKLDPRRTYTVTIVTNCGTFALTLDVKASPKTSASFKVVSGLSVVRAIGALPTSPSGDGTPSPAVVMSKVTVAAS